MCGLVGVFEYGRSMGTVTPDLVVAMRDAVAHRGPDGEGLYISDDRRWGAGHRRLSIVDLANGAQPMFGSSGECLVFNGEIYNYPRLRTELEHKGVRFATNCDTEVILHLYALYGERCLEHLNGMFAFALWDPKVDAVFFARDRVGEKPLYWSDHDGVFVFGSEIKALLKHPSVKRAVNRAAIPGYLTNSVSSPPDTLFDGIHKLPVATAGWCDQRGVRTFSYWSPAPERTWEAGSLDESAARIRALLGDSVRARLMSDVEVGVLLSGGVDSSALVALLHEQGTSLATFSVGFSDQPDLDERKEARWVADRFGTEHHEIEISERDALDFLPRLIFHQDEPLADPVCIPLDFVCGLARDNGVKVVLAGEGADELFWGYARYRRIMRRWPVARALLAAPEPVRQMASRLVPRSRRPDLGDLLEAIAEGRMLPMHMPLGMWSYHRERVLGRKLELRSGWRPVNGAAVSPAEDPLLQLAFDTQEYEMQLRLPELLLMRIDRFSMAHGVEARVPFLEPELVKLAYRLPVDQKLAGGQSKIALKRALEGLVPEEVLMRPKQGFGAPIMTWFGHRMGALLGSLLDEECVRGYFDPGALGALIDEHQFGSSSREWVLWPVLNFALWHKYWIEDEALEPVLAPLHA
jgi:asparagine synthase (glutamine-hydrolysing)